MESLSIIHDTEIRPILPVLLNKANIHDTDLKGKEYKHFYINDHRYSKPFHYCNNFGYMQ